MRYTGYTVYTVVKYVYARVTLECFSLKFIVFYVFYIYMCSNTVYPVYRPCTR